MQSTQITLINTAATIVNVTFCDVAPRAKLTAGMLLLVSLHTSPIAALPVIEPHYSPATARRSCPRDRNLNST